MKGLKRIALVTAIAAAPFASHAGMKALDDSAMGNVTGQGGITIELETRVSIGEFTYTDTDGYAGSGDTDTGGTFAVSGIELGGAFASGLFDPTATDPAFDGTSLSGYSSLAGGAAATASDMLNDLKIDIDVAADGDAVIHVGSITGGPIDWGMQANTIELRGAETGSDSTTLLSGLKAWGSLAALDIRVDTKDVGGYVNSGSLMLDAAFTVEEMEFDVDFLGIGIKGLSITGANAGGELVAQEDIAEMLAKDDEQDSALYQKLVGLASGSIAELNNKSYAVARVDVYKGDGLGASTATDVLRVDVKDVLMDVNIAETYIGGSNIGTIGIDNLHISDTKLAVYGH